LGSNVSAKDARAANVYDIAAGPEGFALCRDGAPLKTPAGAILAVPTPVLAEEIAKEWRAQGKKINHATMPLTQLAATAIDIVGKGRGKIVGQIAAYAESELLCHRAETPPELAERQQRMWQPLLDWCAEHFNARLLTGIGIVPIAQPPEALKALHRAIEAYDDFRLAGLQHAVDVSGSLVLGLALAEGHINAAQAFEAAELDATFQIEKWGDDPAAEKRRAGINHDLHMCERWLELLCPVD
jgi:chaperone required for assembly of F1-ATPase